MKIEDIARLPILQGEENDYGDYDYLANDKPADYHGRRVRDCRCDSCGKEVRVGFESCHYFYTYDGWDSMSYIECSRCYSGSAINKLKAKIRRFINRRKSVRRAKIEVRNAQIFSHKKLTREEKKSLVKLLAK